MNILKKLLSKILIICIIFATMMSASIPVQAKSKKVLDPGIYIINSAVNTSMAIDVSGNGRKNGTKIQLWSEHRGLAQQFRLEYRNNYYVIVHVSSGKVLDVSGGRAANGTKVQLYSYNNTNAQKWELISKGGTYGGGYFSIKSALGNYYLDVKNGDRNKGAQIQIYTGNNTAAQRFYFDSTVNYSYKTVTLSDPKSVADWVKQIKAKQGSVCGFANYGTLPDGKTVNLGTMIVGVEVLKTKVFTIDYPLPGPPVNGKSPTIKRKVKLPTKIRYKTHKHNIDLRSTSQFWGNLIRGAAQLKAVGTFSCPCGLNYTVEWALPVDDNYLNAVGNVRQANYNLSIQSTYIPYTTSGH